MGGLLAAREGDRWLKEEDIAGTEEGKEKKEKLGREVYCQNPWGETKEKIIILSQKHAILFGTGTSWCIIIYHRRAPLIQTDDPL